MDNIIINSIPFTVSKEVVKLIATRFRHHCDLKGIVTNNDTCNEFDTWIQTFAEETSTEEAYTVHAYSKKDTILFATNFANHCMKEANLDINCIGEMLYYQKLLK